ncbi:uncharacterized protein LOC134819480 isoform X2 [Bolinopsis microptera]|uniref:uncharacterized protein LOC134819480 isoform X2 n=1 Tax=Bolinopsis microptera TaxID=2820187 RepID=UPI003078C4D0
MKWVILALFLIFSKLGRISSSQASSNHELVHHSDSEDVHNNIFNTSSDHLRGLKPEIRLNRVALTLNQSLTRNVDYPSVRVYNGDPATVGHIPFIVRIYTYKSGYRYMCGGSILSEHWVVTAAHCILDQAQYEGTNHSFTIHGPNIQIIAGDVSTRLYEASTVVKSVTQVYTHENYNQWYLQSDIALLYIEDGFDLTSANIKKISVADSQPAAGTQVTIAGWGTQETELIATVLQFANYTVPDQKYCQQIYRRKGYYILPGMLCTGDDEMTSHSAIGDSGGPVFRDHGNGNFTLESYKQYRVELHADTTTKWLSWRSGTDTFRYQVYNISCQSGRFVNVVITTLILSQDFSNVIVRDGNQYDSPILLEQHRDLAENQTLSVTSNSNKLLILIRTTNSFNYKLVRFFYSSVSGPAKVSDPLKCGDLISCSNKWECYDPQYQCDGEIADCADWSDEQYCGASGSCHLMGAALGLLVIVWSY